MYVPMSRYDDPDNDFVRLIDIARKVLPEAELIPDDERFTWKRAQASSSMALDYFQSFVMEKIFAGNHWSVLELGDLLSAMNVQTDLPLLKHPESIKLACMTMAIPHVHNYLAELDMIPLLLKAIVGKVLVRLVADKRSFTSPQCEWQCIVRSVGQQLRVFIPGAIVDLQQHDGTKKPLTLYTHPVNKRIFICLLSNFLDQDIVYCIPKDNQIMKHQRSVVEHIRIAAQCYPVSDLGVDILIARADLILPGMALDALYQTELVKPEHLSAMIVAGSPARCLPCK